MDSSSTCAQATQLTALLIAGILASCTANKGWGWGYGGSFNYSHWHQGHVYHHPNATTQGPNKISVGGSENWHFGFNYTDWSIKHGPFYLNDVLVFKYDPPPNNTHPHSVYMLPDFRSFNNCDFSQARMLASTTQGTDEGFEFTLKRWQPYYFACGESYGIHCNIGGMKFMVMPMLRGWNF